MSVSLGSVQVDLNAFVQSCKTLHVSSFEPETGWPEASYAPFVQINNSWYIYVSELAQHTNNLLNFPKASVQLIESELDASSAFARKRISMRVLVHEVPRGTEEFNFVLDRFSEQFGDLVSVLRGLTDFHLFSMQPESGVFVRGFAQAFVLSGEGMRVVSHLREKGERSEIRVKNTSDLGEL